VLRAPFVGPLLSFPFTQERVQVPYRFVSQRLANLAGVDKIDVTWVMLRHEFREAPAVNKPETAIEGRQQTVKPRLESRQQSVKATVNGTLEGPGRFIRPCYVLSATQERKPGRTRQN
jgi:hypothetical protein